MRIPISSRKVAIKTYYVTFAFGGKYSGCYTTVEARNVEQAKMTVIERYGLQNYGGVYIDENHAKALIRAYGLKKVEAK